MTRVAGLFKASWVVIFLVIVTGSIFFYHSESATSRREAIEYLYTVAKMKTSEIETWRMEQLSDANVLMESPFLSEVISEFTQIPSPETIDKLMIRMKSLMVHHQYMDVLLVDSAGSILMSVSGQSGPIHEMALGSVRESLSQHVALITDLHFGANQSPVHMDVISPFYSKKEGLPIAALIVQIPAEKFLYPLITAWPQPDKTAETYLVRKEGESVLVLNDLKYRANTALSLRIPLSQTHCPSVMAVKGNNAFTEGVDYRGTEVFWASMPVPDTEWYIITKIDKAEILSKWRFMAATIIAANMMLFVLSLLVFNIFWQRNERNNLKSLLDIRNEQYVSEERYRTTLLSIGDGVIVVDSRGRIDFMNNIAEILTGWKSEEAGTRPLEDVFCIVDETTREPLTNPVESALHQGITVSLSNHTLLVSRNGREISIADSCAPVRNKEDHIIGAVLVFRDQTYERESTRALRISEERFRNTIENMLEGYQILDHDWRYLYLNKVAAQQGRRNVAEFLGRRIFDVFPGFEKSEAFSVMKECMENKIDRQYESLFITDDGEHNWFQLSIQSTMDGLFILSLDITERKRNEEIVRLANERMRSVVDANIIGIVIADTMGNVIDANDYYLGLIGHTREELISGVVDWRKITPPEWLSADEKAIIELRTHGKCTPYEKEYVRRDGTRISVLLTDVMLPGPEEQIIGMVSDLSSIRKTEAALKESAERLALACDAGGVGIWELDLVNNVLLWDEEMYRLYGTSPNDFQGNYDAWKSRLHPDDLKRSESDLEMAIATFKDFESEFRVIWPDESIHYISAHARIRFDKEGTPLSMLGTNYETTRRKKAEQELIDSRARYQTLFEEATEGIAVVDAQSGVFIDCNHMFIQLTEYSLEELIGKHHSILHACNTDPLEDRNGCIFDPDWSNRENNPHLTKEILTKSGKTCHVEVKSNRLFVDNRSVIQGYFRDITAEINYQLERETTVKILHLLNEKNDIRELLRGITGLLCQWIGCEAIGIRLHDGADYPYYETRGFTDEFIEKENFLCEHHEGMPMISNPDEFSALACMCGNILSGYYDSSLPCFTEKGSFWTNCATELITLPGLNAYRENSRGYCLKIGYESIALIPIRNGQVTHGLIQVDDHRINLFTPGLITFLESTASQLAIALDQRKTHILSKQNEEHYRSLFNNMINGFAYCQMLYDDTGIPVDFVFIEVNKAFESQTSLMNVSGKKASEVIPGLLDKDQGLIELYGKVSVSGSPERFEYYVIALNMWFSCSAYSPQKDYFVSVFDVINERKIAEDKLALHAQRVQALLDLQQLAYASYDDVIQYVLKACLQITRSAYAYLAILNEKSKASFNGFYSLNAEELFDTNSETLNPSRFWNYCETNHTAFMENGPSIPPSDNMVRRLLVNPVYDGHSMVAMAIVINKATDYNDSDINALSTILQKMCEIFARQRMDKERNLLEEQFRQSQKMEAIGQLAGGIAHDFNNILQALVSYSSLLLERIPEKDEMHDFVEEIAKGSHRASSLTRQLLAFSRRQVLKIEDIDLNEVIEGMLKLLRRLIGENIAIETTYANTSKVVHADRGQIEQVILNLCLNARDAMPGGGALMLMTSEVVMDIDYCEINTWAVPGHYVMLSVSDTGCGMDSATQERIFEPFFTTKEMGHGTGLGLATVYGIIRQHQGMIHVYSEVGKGTNIRIYLPGYQHSIAKENYFHKEMIKGKGERILIAEDDETIRILAERILKSAGYRVWSVSNGEEALALFENKEFCVDLCLLDVVMPHLGGNEVFDCLHDKYPHLKFIFSSGYSTAAVTKELVHKKDFILIQKPYTPDILLRQIRDVLDMGTSNMNLGDDHSGEVS